MGRLVISLILLGFMVSCAQQRMPSGGEKDIHPPVLVSASPAPMSTQFSGSRIELTFDEYVQIKGVRDQVLISPPPEEFPEISVRGGRKLLIDFGEQALRENTTYTVNLGEALSDINESNILQENVFLFSTGDYIDSLEISGRLLLAEYMSPCVGCLALLYPDLPDSMLYRNRPSYVGRSDAEGNFLISNLAQGEYRLMALRDIDSDLKISSYETMGFADALVVPQEIDSIGQNLRLFNPKSALPSIKDYSWSEDGLQLTLVTQGLNEVPKLGIDSPELVLLVDSLGGRSDSLRYWFDVQINDLDELAFDLDGFQDTIGTARSATSAELESLELSWSIEHVGEPLRVIASRPVRRINQSRITLLQDSMPVMFTVSETSLPRLSFDIEADTEEGVFYDLRILPGAIEDVYELRNDSIEQRVRVPEERTFGSLALDLKFPSQDSQYVLQLLDKKKTPIATQSLSVDSLWLLEHLSPGAYTLRVVADENEDGEWTTGDFEGRRQAEKVYMSEQPITIRANWEVEQRVEVEFK